MRIEVCDLCYTSKGEVKEATGYYQPSPIADTVYICEDCKEIVKKAGFIVFELD